MSNNYCKRQIFGAPGINGVNVKDLKLVLKYYNQPLIGKREEISKRINDLQKERNISSPELMIMIFLLRENIKFYKEYSWGKFRYDFYLPEYNIYIEYNGEGHFDIKYRNQGLQRLQKCRKHDIIKAYHAIKNSEGIIIIDENHKNINDIEQHISFGLQSREKLYLSDKNKLNYINVGIRKRLNARKV